MYGSIAAVQGRLRALGSAQCFSGAGSYTGLSCPDWACTLVHAWCLTVCHGLTSQLPYDENSARMLLSAPDAVYVTSGYCQQLSTACRCCQTAWSTIQRRSTSEQQLAMSGSLKHACCAEQS